MLLRVLMLMAASVPNPTNWSLQESVHGQTAAYNRAAEYCFGSLSVTVVATLSDACAGATTAAAVPACCCRPAQHRP
jgi:hypothetical protein